MNAITQNMATYKTRLYGQFAKIGRALANSRRLEILDLLSQGDRTVESIATEIGTTVSNVSQHLQILRGSGLVDSRKDGLFVHYRLSGESVAGFWQAMRRLAVGVSPELRELISLYVESRDQLEPVPHAELLDRVRSGQVTVIDVRPLHEYKAGHIPAAISIPLDELEERMKELPSSGEVVAYCRGPYCLLSIEAVDKLRQKGYRARRLADGFPEWKADGHPVKTAALTSTQHGGTNS